MMENRKLNTREEVDARCKWAIEDLYKNDEDWKSDYELLKSRIPELAKFRGRLGESAQVLLSMQKLSDELNQLLEKVYVYANQRLHENTDNSTYQNLASQAQELLVELSESMSFVEPELMELPDGTIETFLKENKELSVYRQYFENIIRQKKHVLPTEQEALLAAMGDVAESPKDIFSMFNNADICFPEITGEDGHPVQVTHGRYMSLMQSDNRQMRKSAFEAMYGVYGDWRNTLAAMYRANVKQEAFLAKAHKYTSDLEAALDGSHIPIKVYEQLIEAVHESMPLMYRYMKLRKKLLGVDELHMYDLYVPMTEQDHSEIPFEQAKETVLEGLAPMGEEYLNLLREGFDHGWIDVYENQQYTIVADQHKLGNDVTALMEVSLEHPKYYDEFTKVMEDNESIVACDYLTGDYDFMLKIQTQSSETLEHLHRIIKSIRGVSATKTYFVLKEIKCGQTAVGEA